MAFCTYYNKDTSRRESYYDGELTAFISIDMLLAAQDPFIGLNQKIPPWKDYQCIGNIEALPKQYRWRVTNV